MFKQWIIQEPNPEQQYALARTLSISPITASVLLARGMLTAEQARGWLSPHQVRSHDPFLLPDMERAVDRLHQAITEGEPIAFYGDYDVDGISATSLYLSFFRGRGAQVRAYIPHRIREGYGLNELALRDLRREGIRLVVTSDCGTTSHHEVQVANGLGIDVIVTDHHQIDTHLPPALAVLNPHRPDSVYPFRELCSGALAYKVVQAYAMKYGAGDVSLEQVLDLVGLATVADVVPLQDENRQFVRQGLAHITRGSRAGIRALKRSAGIDQPCTTMTLAYKLAPRINAAGRLAHAELGVRLLTTESDMEAAMLAGELENLNRERQQIEEGIKAEAFTMVGSTSVPAAIVLGSRRWHLGVVGIVAARLVERFNRPTVLLAVSEDGLGKGSARSVAGFDLHAALSACRDLLVGFGGHPSAAGLTIREDNIPAFRDRFAQLAAEWGEGQPQNPRLHVDAEVNLTQVDHRVVRELELLQPFGSGNPEPTLVVRNLSVLQARVVGGRHLKITVRHRNSVPFDGIGFRMGSFPELGLSTDKPVDLAFVPQLETWRGLDRIQLRIRDLRASQAV